MKKESRFLTSFERYVRKSCKRIPVPYPYYAILLVSLILITSVFNVKNSVVDMNDIHDVVRKAAKSGDYQLAERLYHQSRSNISDSVLGEDSSIDDVVYPEKVVERRILSLEIKLSQYPGNREIYLELANLYKQIGNSAKSLEYREKARILDPNNLVPVSD